MTPPFLALMAFAFSLDVGWASGRRLGYCSSCCLLPSSSEHSLVDSFGSLALLSQQSIFGTMDAESAVKKLARSEGNMICPNCLTRKKFGFSTVCIKYLTFVSCWLCFVACVCELWSEC